MQIISDPNIRRVNLEFSEVKDYHVWEIEKIAHDTLCKLSNPPFPIPIDVEYLADGILNFPIDTRDFIEEKYATTGVCWRNEPGSYTIVIDTKIFDTAENFSRFTIAEEIGHIILHEDVMDKIRNIEDVAQFHNWEKYHEIDHNGKRFAAELLIPKNNIINSAENLYPLFADEDGFNNLDAIRKAMTTKLSREYLVSREVMKHRLNHHPMKIFDRVDKSFVKKSLNLMP